MSFRVFGAWVWRTLGTPKGYINCHISSCKFVLFFVWLALKSASLRNMVVTTSEIIFRLCTMLSQLFSYLRLGCQCTDWCARSVCQLLQRAKRSDPTCSATLPWPLSLLMVSSSGGASAYSVLRRSPIWDTTCQQRRVRPLEDKVEAIKQAAAPTNVFITQFSLKTKASCCILCILFGTLELRWNWTAERNQPFNKANKGLLAALLSSSKYCHQTWINMVLVVFWSVPCQMAKNASLHALSHMLTGAERRYSVLEQEALVTIFDIK